MSAALGKGKDERRKWGVGVLSCPIGESLSPITLISLWGLLPKCGSWDVTVYYGGSPSHLQHLWFLSQHASSWQVSLAMDLAVPAHCCRLLRWFAAVWQLCDLKD